MEIVNSGRRLREVLGKRTWPTTNHGLSRVTGMLKSGQDVDMWFRMTLGFRRIVGRWLVVHDYGSDPFDPENGKASLGLKP